MVRSDVIDHPVLESTSALVMRLGTAPEEFETNRGGPNR